MLAGLLWASFAVLLLLLAWKSPAPFRLGDSYGDTVAALEAYRQGVEAWRAAHGAYPPSGPGWKVLGNGAPPASLPQDMAAFIASRPPFADPAQAPATSLLYQSDGKDYKLIAHLADARPCVQARAEAPALVDPARLAYLNGFSHAPGWFVTSPAEMATARAFLEQRGKLPPRQDEGLSLPLRGTCWALGYWTPGAAAW